MALNGKEVRVLDINGEEVFKGTTRMGKTVAEDLPEYAFASGEKTFRSPYTVLVGKKKQKVELTGDSAITIVTR
jgi:hypothetical protein